VSFELLLDTIIGPREYFHVMECHLCGFDEIYYQHPITKEQVGMACKGCNYVKKFDFLT
jgi:ribosomal protein S27E